MLKESDSIYRPQPDNSQGSGHAEMGSKNGGSEPNLGGSELNLTEQAQQIQDNIDDLISRVNDVSSTIHSHQPQLEEHGRVCCAKIEALSDYGKILLGFLKILRKNIKNNSFRSERAILAQIDLFRDWEVDLTEKTEDWIRLVEQRLERHNISLRQPEQ